MNFLVISSLALGWEDDAIDILVAQLTCETFARLFTDPDYM